jgi:hypothetical protein
VLRWVGECGESCPLISPARGRTCRRLVPVVMAVPPTAMPGVRQVGGVDHGGCCAPVTMRARPFVVIGLAVVGRNGTLVVMAAVCALSFIWIQLIAQRHGLVVCLLRARTGPGQVAQRRMRVSVMVLVFEVASSAVLAGVWSSGCGSGGVCVAGC